MNVTINILELASKLAEQELFYTWHEDILIYEVSDEETRYTEEAQPLFDELYDKYYYIIEQCKI